MSITPFFENEDSKDNEERNKEFENALGNLLVAEFQVYRLRERVKNFINTASSDKKSSEFMFKIDNDWFRIAVTAEKHTVPNVEKEEEKKETENNVDSGFIPTTSTMSQGGRIASSAVIIDDDVYIQYP